MGLVSRRQGRSADEESSKDQPDTLSVAPSALPICFLLADGRFQPFEALRLELQFDTEEELRVWATALWQVCGDKSAPPPDFASDPGQPGNVDAMAQFAES